MTSIRDISDKIINIHGAYKESCDETNILYSEYTRKRNKFLHLPFEKRSNFIYKEVFSFINACQRKDDLKYKYDRAHYLNNSHIQTNKLSSQKMRSLHPEMCGICMEHHTYRTMVTTSCLHHFGKECFSKWIQTCLNKNQDVSCALCRNTNFKITGYIDKKHK
jgi:hypothetical protein